MPVTNPLASATTSIQSELTGAILNAVGVIAPAIALLLGVLVGIWWFLRLLGIRVGLSETARQRIRDKAAKRRAAFPLALSRINTKKQGGSDVSVSGGPWMDPNKGFSVYHRTQASIALHRLNLVRAGSVSAEDIKGISTDFNSVFSIDILDSAVWQKLTGRERTRVLDIASRMLYARHVGELGRAGESVHDIVEFAA